MGGSFGVWGFTGVESVIACLRKGPPREGLKKGLTCFNFMFLLSLMQRLFFGVGCCMYRLRRRYYINTTTDGIWPTLDDVVECAKDRP